MTDWPYVMRVFAPENTGGHLLIETRHRTQGSKGAELLACRERYRRGEIGRVEVVDRDDHRGCRSYPPFPD